MNLLDLLSGVGNVLDTPGRFARTAISGAGTSLMNLLSGTNNEAADPWAAILDPSQGRSGRQLLEQAGLAGENVDQGWVPDAGDLGGFAAEMVLDPTNLIGGGLLARLFGKAGKAKAANQIADLANVKRAEFLDRLQTAPRFARTQDTASVVARELSPQSSAIRGYLPGPSASTDLMTRLSGGMAADEPGLLLRANFPVPSHVQRDLFEASNDPFIGSIAKRSGVQEVSFDSPHTFELSQQGGVTSGGTIRLNPDVEDVGNTLLHELGHVFWGRSSDAQRATINSALKAARESGFSHYADTPEEALAELFGFARGKPNLQEMLGFTPEGKTLEQLFPPKAAKSSTASLATDVTQPARVRSWEDIGKHYLTQEDDLRAIVKKHGDRMLIIKDTNGGRHAVMASKAAEMLDDPVVSGYVDSVFPPAKEWSGAEKLDEYTLSYLPNLNKAMQKYMTGGKSSAKAIEQVAKKRAIAARELAERNAARAAERKREWEAYQATLPPPPPIPAHLLPQPARTQANVPFASLMGLESQAAALSREQPARLSAVPWSEGVLPSDIPARQTTTAVPSPIPALTALMAHNALARFRSQRN